jgi:Domain of unknown function (DUF222)
MDPLLEVPVPPPPDYGRLTDEQLVAFAVQTQVTENAQHARRLRAFAEVYTRCERDHQARRANASQVRFVLTPGEETGVEFATALGITAQTVQVELHFYERLSSQFPTVWSMCETGRLDLSKAALILDAAESIADAADVGRFAELMDAYLARHDDPSSPLITLTRQQVQNAARYRKLKFRQKTDEQSFHEAFAKRRVRLDLDANGMGHLGCTNMGTDLTAANYRLTLIAKKLCENDEQGRTLEQMRADVMVDLMLGRLDVGALNSELEDDQTLDGRDPAELIQRQAAIGAFARPVINVTVPITSLLGVTDEPGLLSGDRAIPAEVVRRIAADPSSTWYRLLTDAAGEFAHLSTTSYQPTKPIWRATVAKERCCVWPGCCRPAVECELDHRLEYPAGTTCACNLQPLCRFHHKVKHSESATLTLEDDGSYTVTTRRGTIARGRPSEQPVANWPIEHQGLGDGEEVARAS